MIPAAPAMAKFAMVEETFTAKAAMVEFIKIAEMVTAVKVKEPIEEERPATVVRVIGVGVRVVGVGVVVVIRGGIRVVISGGVGRIVIVRGRWVDVGCAAGIIG